MSFVRREKKRKKGRMDNPEGIACPAANATSHLTFDRKRWVISCGSKSLFDMRFWMYYSERTDTQFNLRYSFQLKSNMQKPTKLATLDLYPDLVKAR